MKKTKQPKKKSKLKIVIIVLVILILISIGITIFFVLNTEKEEQGLPAEVQGTYYFHSYNGSAVNFYNDYTLTLNSKKATENWRSRTSLGESSGSRTSEYDVKIILNNNSEDRDKIEFSMGNMECQVYSHNEIKCKQGKRVVRDYTR